jgi:hypothetical protein
MLWATGARHARLQRLNRARVFITASRNESFGIALAEALACGTTCVNGECMSGRSPRRHRAERDVDRRLVRRVEGYTWHGCLLSEKQPLAGAS